MPMLLACCCALLLLSCTRPTPAPNVLEHGVEQSLVSDTLPGTTPLDWRSIGPVPIGEPEPRFRPYAELSRPEQHALDSTADALRVRGVVICY